MKQKFYHQFLKLVQDSRSEGPPYIFRTNPKEDQITSQIIELIEEYKNKISYLEKIKLINYLPTIIKLTNFKKILPYLQLNKKNSLHLMKEQSNLFFDLALNKLNYPYFEELIKASELNFKDFFKDYLFLLFSKKLSPYLFHDFNKEEKKIIIDNLSTSEIDQLYKFCLPSSEENIAYLFYNLKLPPQDHQVVSKLALHILNKERYNFNYYFSPYSKGAKNKIPSRGEIFKTFFINYLIDNLHSNLKLASHKNLEKALLVKLKIKMSFLNEVKFFNKEEITKLKHLFESEKIDLAIIEKPQVTTKQKI